MVSLHDSNTLKVKYPAGSFNPRSPIRGGVDFVAAPITFPSSEACFMFNVTFPTNFMFFKGGKLLEMYIGDYGASGGNHIKTGASFRLMWRANGSSEAYLYVPRQLDSFYA